MKKLIYWTLPVVAALFIAFVPARADAGKQAAGQKGGKPQVKIDAEKAKTAFMRITRNKDGEATAMKTGIVRYVPAKGNKDFYVDLVSVVHIGEKAYYSRLNDRFENYDVVLYELVAPKGVIPRPGRKSDNPIAFLQQMMTVFLQLDSQTKCVDYTAKNFVHADLTPTQMAKKMKERGDTPLTIAISAFADIMREQNKLELKRKKNPGKRQPDLDIFSLMSDPQASTKLKRMMAEQMVEMGDGSGLGKTLNTLLIDDRNAAAMKVFQKQLVAGKKKIAIFYGAAHMPDFERRLVQDFGMRKQSVDWVTAWDLRPRQLNPFDLLKSLQK